MNKPWYSRQWYHASWWRWPWKKYGLWASDVWAEKSMWGGFDCKVAEAMVIVSPEKSNEDEVGEIGETQVVEDGTSGQLQGRTDQMRMYHIAHIKWQYSKAKENLSQGILNMDGVGLQVIDNGSWVTLFNFNKLVTNKR